MAQQYGYLQPRNTPVKPRQPSLAFAAGGQSGTSRTNPFGLAGGSGGILGLNDQAHYRAREPVPAYRPPTTQPAAPRVNPLVAQQAANTAPTPNGVYDINTDPALLQINAYTNMSDEQAKAAADKQRRDLVLGFGDPDLANKLGYGDLAAAAADNPTSTKHQLGQQHDRKVHDLTEALNQANLTYGGYRITQEQQAAEDYQNALAQAAAQVNAALGGIDSNLAALLGGNLQQRLAALQNAYKNAPKDQPVTAPQTDAGSSPFALPYSTVAPDDQIARLLAGLAPIGGF